MSQPPDHRPLTLAHLSALDLPPPRLITAAARAGFDGVGLRLVPVTETTPGYPLSQAQDLRATKQALRDTGLFVNDVEFLKLTPEFDPRAYEWVLEMGAELGARHVILAPYDDDLSRLSDRLAGFNALAEPRGLRPVLEFFPWTSVPDLPTCLEVVTQAGPGPGVLVDALHFDRAPRDAPHDEAPDFNALKAVPAQRLPFAHLCDAPRHPPYSTEDLLYTARQDRRAPGAGEIDLLGFLDALPAGLPLGVEVPLHGIARSEIDQALATLCTASKRLLEKSGAAKT